MKFELHFSQCTLKMYLLLLITLFKQFEIYTFSVCFQYIYRVVQPPTNRIQIMIITLPKKSLSCYQISHSSPLSSPRELPIYFLPLYICQFYTFLTDEIIQMWFFCNWLLSFRIIFSSSIHVVSCISISVLFIAE